LTAKPQNTLSPGLWIQMNPAYRLGEKQKTHYTETFGRSAKIGKIWFNSPCIFKDGLLF